QQLVKQLEEWLAPSRPAHLDSPRAMLRVLCRHDAAPQQPGRRRLGVRFYLLRPRTGEKLKTLAGLLGLTTRAAHEQELFRASDWEFIEWLAKAHAGASDGDETLFLSEVDLLHWLARWGQTARLELDCDGRGTVLEFCGQVAELMPHLENGDRELSFTHRLV